MNKITMNSYVKTLENDNLKTIGFSSYRKLESQDAKTTERK